MSDSEFTGLAEARLAGDAADAIGADVRTMLRRAILLWAIRWTFGVAIIWAITGWTGRFDWLWIVGAVFAALSLAVTLAAQFLLARKIDQTHEKLHRLETLLREEAET